MISNAVSSRREHVSGQPLELVLEIVPQRPVVVQCPVRVEVHQSSGVMVDQFRRRVRDDVIVINEAKSAGLESCVIGFRKQAIARARLAKCVDPVRQQLRIFKIHPGRRQHRQRASKAVASEPQRLIIRAKLFDLLPDFWIHTVTNYRRRGSAKRRDDHLVIGYRISLGVVYQKRWLML